MYDIDVDNYFYLCDRYYLYMNFQQLEYIIAVDKLKHFARAADSCHVTQATLSVMVKKLEEELGLVIFDRKKQPVLTTVEGMAVIELAKKILSLQYAMQQLTAQPEGPLTGELTLGIIPTIANSLLSLILKPILDAHPDLTLTITEITTEEIIRQLNAGTLDAGLLATPLNDPDIEENILYYEAMMVYGVDAPDKKYILPSDFDDENIWLLEEGHCFRNQTVTICRIQEKSLEPSNFHFAGSSFETLLNLTDQFGGYTLIPELYYHQLSPDRQARTRSFEKPVPVREISLVYRRPYARRMIIDGVAEQIRDLVQGKLVTQEYKASELSIIGI